MMIDILMLSDVIIFNIIIVTLLFNFVTFCNIKIKRY